MPSCLLVTFPSSPEPAHPLSLRDIPLTGGPPLPFIRQSRRSRVNGFAAGKNASLSCERSGAVSSVTLTLHKCGMLRLLQIAEILNLAHFVHSLGKFLRDFRKNISTCFALELFLLSAGCAIYIRGYSPNPFLMFQSKQSFCHSEAEG